ncbi:hypothetical protein [Flavobacterium sp. UMI-01]|uniref:hypothetical protein n=1 Tax=Flavobacterium sp. UMI-01 TaxID=1441053 RepID=UPI001C7D2904|nr:hypothetical protein [Flavobacterium sp. UMI-01]GIZ09020.1 hypothetical protein FUMI01_17470 [Flavobacterium sp. UMI-01]
MSNQNKHTTSKEQNEYAKNVEGESVFILDAISGRKGYWCIGCDAPMEAVIQKKNTLHKSYFRHIAKDVAKGEIPCTFSNQDFRHNLAIDILQRTKRIKVPNLYKYAPDGKSAKLIQEATFVEAHSVKKELSFYEDDHGEVQFGKNPEIDNKNLLIRPDVTFFDSQGKPILLIEIVVSHKLNDEKKAKIRRLGIDTIQIVIPKDSPENIAKNFLVTKNTKWVFNHVEQNSNYFQLPTGHTEGISQIDELQMGFFGESIVCRKNQISNLIRSITRCVESQLYKRVEFNIGQEISRIEESTRKHQSKLDEIQAGIEREIYSELGSRGESIDATRRKLEEKNRNLEERYFKRKRKIAEEQADIVRQIEHTLRDEKPENSISAEFAAEERRIEHEIERIKREQGYIEEDTRKESNFAGNFAGEEFRISNQESELEQEFRTLEDQERESFETFKRQFQSETTDERKLRTTIEEEFRSGYQWLYEQIAERISERDCSGNDPLSQRIETILELRGLCSGYTAQQQTLERYRKGIQYLANGTYKTWDK